MTTENQKFNEIMPETTECALCMKIYKTITSQGYEENFLPRINEMIETQGTIRVLVYFKDFKGWEADAARNDMQTYARVAKKFTKIALVNPPETEVFRRFVKRAAFTGKLELFNESDLNEAIEWVNA